MAKKRKRDFDPYDAPSIRRVRELYVKEMRELMAKQGVSSVDELKMSPEARRAFELLSPFWRDALTSG